MSDFTYECSVCLDDVTEPRGEQSVRSIDESYLCEACAPAIVEMFEKAVQNELEYPPKWGGAKADFDVFKDLMSEDLVATWHSKELEYKTSIQDRIYCQQKVVKIPAESGHEPEKGFCNHFIGGRSSSRKSPAKCPGCEGFTCFSCRNPLDQPDEVHGCNISSRQVQQETYGEATRGKEWQRCPRESCKLQVELKDGCNEMHCPICEMNFCFICGKEAEHDSLHWSRPNPCTRWHHPDAENAQFDNHDMPDHVAEWFVLEFPETDDEWDSGMMWDDSLLVNDLWIALHNEVEVEYPEAKPEILIEFLGILSMLFDNLERARLYRMVSHPDHSGTVLRPDETTSAEFLTRDEQLMARFHQVYQEALEMPGLRAWEFAESIPEVFESYVHSYKPRLLDLVESMMDEQQNEGVQAAEDSD